MKTPTRKQPRIVDSGPGWHIEYSPLDRQYSAHTAAGVIAYERTLDAARLAISKHQGRD